MKFSKHFQACAGAVIVATMCAAASAAETDPYPPVKFDMPNHAEFVASLKLTDGRHEGPAAGEEAKKALVSIFNDKTEQHALSKHADTGMTCISCHDQQSVKSPDWMTAVTAPAMKKNCQDCHTTQDKVFKKTDTHQKIDCIACHMPNMPSADEFKGPDGTDVWYSAVRRSHLYKINTDKNASTFTNSLGEKKEGERVWDYARDEEGHGYVDIMWSCGRATPADHTLSGEGQGCHSKATSTLDEGLIYKDQSAIYEEILKYQTPVKEAYQKAKGGIERMRELLEITKLKPADQTDVRLLLDKAQDIVDEIDEDGSWGMHAPRYLRDRAEAAVAYVDKAQTIIDQGGYDAKAKK